MDSRFDHVAFLLRARHAVLGGGSLQVRWQGKSRLLVSRIPGTSIRAMMKEQDGKVTGCFMRKKSGSVAIDLDKADELHRYMMTWDTVLMFEGIGASFFPVAALEFVDALVFEEGRRDILSIRPIVSGPVGFSIDPGPEWKPTSGLCELIAEYVENPKAQAATKAAAASLLRFMEDTEDKVFDPTEWNERWLVQILKEACRLGREIPSANGIWREMLSGGALAAAVRHLSRRSPNASEASAAMSSHLGTFMSRYPVGGSDLYLLWSADGHPAAIAAVGADGSHVSMTPPTADMQILRETDVGALLEAVGSVPERRKNGRSATSGGV